MSQLDNYDGIDESMNSIAHQIFTIIYRHNDKFIANIEFDATDEEQTELINASKERFINVKVVC